MRYLLDSHVFLWFFAEPEKLRPEARRTIENDENEIFLSVASVWELGLKAALGKLALPCTVREYVSSRTQQAAIEILPVRLTHVFVVNELPFHHRDPFDRILVAQTKCEGLILVTDDRQMEKYGVRQG